MIVFKSAFTMIALIQLYKINIFYKARLSIIHLSCSSLHSLQKQGVETLSCH